MKSQNPLPIRLITHNIRYATDHPFAGEEEWSVRKSRIVNELRFTTTHCGESFICLQEVLHHQLIDILNGLNSDHNDSWDFIGVGREDGMSAGEYSPVLFRPSVWKLQSWETVWLSPEPDRPSKGWDAACKRILTIGIFQHYQSRKKLVAMNTHLDHKGPKSRSKAAEIILKQIDEKSQQGQWPVFLAGDFNSKQDDDAYLTLTSENSPMKDTHKLLSAEQRYGHHSTFTGFGNEVPTKIDFLFVNQKTYPWLAQNHAVLANIFDDKVYNSDHRAVVADLMMP